MQFCQFLLQLICNKIKGRILKRQIQENKARKNSQKLTGANSMLTFGIFCVLCFLVTIVFFFFFFFLRFTPFPYYQKIKAGVFKIILGSVSGYFEKKYYYKRTSHSINRNVFQNKQWSAQTLQNTPSTESAPTTCYFIFQYRQQMSANCTFQLTLDS